MAITNSAGKILNPLSTALTGGVVPAANVIIDVGDWADALAPRLTPILSRCKKLPTAKAYKHEWGQSYHTAISGTLNEALDTSETDVTLSSGEGLLLQPWMVLRVINYVSGTSRLDYSRQEIILVRATDGTDTIPSVRRAQGGTTAIAHDDGAFWEVIGTALPHSTDFQLSPFTRGDRLFNYPQRFYGEVAADRVARGIDDYENKGDILLKDFRKEQIKQKHLLERAIVVGGRQEGDANGTPTTDTQIPYMTGGIDYFVTNHSGRVVNMAGATLNPYDLEDIMVDMYNEIEDGGAKTLLMSANTARMFDSFLNPIREATVKDDSINLTVNKINLRFGEIEVQHTRYLDDGTILFVDFSDIGVYPMPKANWQTEKIATKGPYDIMALWGEFGVEVKEVTRMAKLWNFNTDLSAYPRRNWM
jgi:hypothetical protein